MLTTRGPAARTIRDVKSRTPRPAWHWYALAGVLLSILLALELSGVAAPLGP